jgi:Lanthionine synthetase C-like protein
VTALYDPGAHEPLTATPWDDGWVRGRIAEIVADAEEALDGAGWPNHPHDDPDDLPERPTSLYLGAGGMVWALHRLGSSLALAALIDDVLRRYRVQPDFGDEDVPGLLIGESGLLLVAHVLGAGDHARLRARIRENVRNETWELMWGSPGTIIAARFAGLDDEAREGAAVLADEWDRKSGLWTQHLYGRVRRFTGPAHGFAGNAHALRGYLDDDELHDRVAATVERYAVREDGLANWPPVLDAEKLDRVQWCHGAPGIVATLGDLMPRDLLLAGAELTWQAGPLVKGPGLCHGTAGNGYAFLRTHAVTGDDVWLERARSFAVHALEQVEQTRAEFGRGRYSLYTGDVGAALFVKSCLEVDPRFPTVDVW